ncbi:phosphoribosyltransferase-like protein [Cupriavidus necator]
MPTEMSVLDSQAAKAWLQQFALRDQKLAADLLGVFSFVSRDEFASGLMDQVLHQAESVNGPIALYAERELGHRLGVPHRLFKESTGKAKRAYGVGPQPVKATKAYQPEVGSEGLVAQLITDLCRRFPKRFLNHPGPDLIRRTRARAFWVLTDFVGSGKRTYNYLSAAWKVRSVRSWKSGGFLRFGVIAYAMTQSGQSRIDHHPCKPLTSCVQPCPTIFSAFSRSAVDAYVSLCERYDPVRPKAGTFNDNGFLGYGGVGALIAFAHGAPNNAPRIFHKTSRRANGWIPLFPARVTAGLPPTGFGRSLRPETISARLDALGNKVLAKSPAARDASIEVKKRYLVLAALSRGQRGNVILAIKTGLSTFEVEQVCLELESFDWVSPRRVLTDAGLGELRHLRRTVAQMRQRVSTDAEVEKPPYYPTSLRAPIIPSS